MAKKTRNISPSQASLDLADQKKKTGPIDCLGRTFENDEARREHYLALLAEKLKDPDFRKISGFPKGTDEDILRLSDPPYYTACPNPFLDEFVKVNGTPYDPDEEYNREPFAVDVSVGKTDQLYKAHGYHTKVPHLAIVPSILHYTNPGDIVLDGFCGSGMTGVAAQWCGTAPTDYKQKLEEEWKQLGHTTPKWGARKVILGDLGPAASFIAANYNIPFDVNKFAKAAQKILDEVEDELGWMYETLHTDGKTKARINYTVWSEVFSCPECSGEIVFLEQAWNEETSRVLDDFTCRHCQAHLKKKQLERIYETKFDSALGIAIKSPTRHPVFVNYSIGKKHYQRSLNDLDWSVISRVAATSAPTEIPITEFPMNDMWEAPRLAGHGITHVHHLYLTRAAQVLSLLWAKMKKENDARLRSILSFWIDSQFANLSIRNRYRPQVSFPYNPMSGVYYISALVSEADPFRAFRNKVKRMVKAFESWAEHDAHSAITTGDCSAFELQSDSIDYVFTDPPFGDNFPYSELNFSVEAWSGVLTNRKPEAVVERGKKNGNQKGVLDYQRLMQSCFAEYNRVLKPGRWMTVVFSNSKNNVWRAIQEAMGTAGFVVADVRTLDKKQLSFKQVTSASVKQDLVISAYKPSEALLEQFKLDEASIDSVWAFVDEHLHNVPLAVVHADGAEVVAERTAQMLHDRMIAFFVQRHVAVPISGPDFFTGLSSRYSVRDDMYFLQNQVATYDKKRSKINAMRQLNLYVSDEASATQWIRQRLQGKPQTFQDLQPQFMQHLQSWAKHEKTVELKEILELNFFKYEGKGTVPSQIHSYLSTNFKDLRNLDKEDDQLKDKALDRWYVPLPKKEGDLAKLRTRTLLREFDEYKTSTKRKIKQFRTEAVRAGFKHCYDEQDYQTIVDVAAKLPEKVIQEDEKLLMYYDVASMRLGGDL